MHLFLYNGNKWLKKIIDTGGNHQRLQTIARCAVTLLVTIDAVVATISFCRLLNSGNHGLLYCRLLTKIVHAKWQSWGLFAMCKDRGSCDNYKQLYTIASCVMCMYYRQLIYVTFAEMEILRLIFIQRFFNICSVLKNFRITQYHILFKPN